MEASEPYLFDPAQNVGPHYNQFVETPVSVGYQFPVPPFAPVTEPGAPTASDILRAMATTFEERNKVYGSNYKMVAPIMAVLFPDGPSKEVVFKDSFHLFELIIVKLSRFAIQGLDHLDSIHDAGVYCAMIEMILKGEEHERAQQQPISRG